VRCSHIEADGGATACIPLNAQGQQLGFLYVSAADDGFMSRVQLIETAAEQLAMALSNLELQERLRIQSIREPLTGLFNRRYLEESLARELARCERRGLPLAVMMLDLDHFKRFNDTHGHPGGDALLAGFGALLQSLSRQEDIACRYGGEEFTLILPEAGPQAALERAEQIRVAVEGMRIQHLGKDLPPVTVSIGLAFAPDDGVDPESLVRHADRALYKAKSRGRNRVESDRDPQRLGAPMTA
jgi:diguanylate cyclase (GGDEF)-like protein